MGQYFAHQHIVKYIGNDWERTVDAALYGFRCIRSSLKIFIGEVLFRSSHNYYQKHMLI